METGERTDAKKGAGSRWSRISVNILVTGGGGFIGSHTCKALANAGMSPIVYDNLSTGHRDAVRWGAARNRRCPRFFAPCTGHAAARRDGHPALRGVGLCGRIRNRSAKILFKQRRWNGGLARGGAPSRALIRSSCQARAPPTE